MGTDSAQNRLSYEERLSRVQTYIHNHLSEDLDLNRLAEIACLSPHHWHRIYHGVFGETVAATVKRVRLHTAAGMLANSKIAIDKIARECGYANLQSFTRIFAERYGMPPAQYRREGSHQRFANADANAFSQSSGAGPHTDWQVRIETVPEQMLLTVEHQGSFMEIGKAFDRLFGWLAVRNLITPDVRLIGLYYQDPFAVSEEELRSKAGALVPGKIDLSTPVEQTKVAGGRYAVLRYQGPYADMRSAYLWLFGKWLPQSGEELRDGPVFEEYLNNPRDTAPSDLLTDIYMPLQDLAEG